jgi:hypothetical protein
MIEQTIQFNAIAVAVAIIAAIALSIVKVAKWRGVVLLN